VHIPVFADADQDTASLPQLAVPYRPAVGGENGTHIDSKIREA
jgi:hypothetical protein